MGTIPYQDRVYINERRILPSRTNDNAILYGTTFVEFRDIIMRASVIPYHGSILTIICTC